MFEEKEHVKKFVSDLVGELGDKNKFLFLSTKTTKTNYLEEYVKELLPQDHRVIGHYGNLRGINDAKDCNIVFMLGSYLPSDAVEIAMAIGLIQDKLPANSITETENYFWKWMKTNSCRVYTKDYKIIQELAEAYRFSEHRQAMARARYLNHDVDFYVLSKDRIKKYEKHPVKMFDEQFRADLFPPRKKRSDTKYPDFVNYVYDWFKTHKTLKQRDIYENENYDISKGTVSDHIKTMHEEGLLALAPNKKTIYILLPPKLKNGHPTL